LDYSLDAGFGQSLIASKASDARRRGATTEAYGAIRRKEERALARLRREGNAPDDALMADQSPPLPLTSIVLFPIFPKDRKRSTKERDKIHVQRQ